MKKTTTNDYNAPIGNLVAEVTGQNATGIKIYDDLAAIKALVSEMNTHSAELSFPEQQRMQFEEQLNILKEQIQA